MKKFMTLALMATLSVSTAACSKAADVPLAEMTQEQLSKMIVGKWAMEDITMQESGIEVRMYESSAQYNADGTSAGEAKMSFEAEQMPIEMRGYKITGKTTWTLDGKNLRETVAGTTVTPLSDSPDAMQMAAAIQDQMRAAPPIVSTIVSATKTQLVLEQNGQTLTLNRK